MTNSTSASDYTNKPNTHRGTTETDRTSSLYCFPHIVGVCIVPTYICVCALMCTAALETLLQEGHSTGRKSRGSSSSGREGGRERTGRNIISNDSARVSQGEAFVEDGGGLLAVDGLFSSKPRDSTDGGVELGGGGGGYNRRKTAPEPPPYHDDDTAVTREPQLPVPSSSFSVNARSTAPAPASTVPERNGGGHRGAARAGPGVVLEDPVYLVTDTYPYTYKQFDRQDEERLLVSKQAFGQVLFLFVSYVFFLQRHAAGVEIQKSAVKKPCHFQVFSCYLGVVWGMWGGGVLWSIAHPGSLPQRFRIQACRKTKRCRRRRRNNPPTRSSNTHNTHNFFMSRASTSVGWSTRKCCPKWTTTAESSFSYRPEWRREYRRERSFSFTKEKNLYFLLDA